MQHKLLAIIGPTASGKTQLAAQVAAQVGAHILSADSRQVYTGLDIGSGKDLKDYIVNGQQVPYHLIDIAEVGQEFNVFNYQKAFFKVYDKLAEQNTPAIVAGGSGLYIEAVLNGYALPSVPENPQLRQHLNTLSDSKLLQMLKTYGPLHNTTDALDRSRTIRAIEIEAYKTTHDVPVHTPPKAVVVCINPTRAEVKRKITNRLKNRLNNGLIDEVEDLINKGITAEQLKFLGLEYKFITQYLQNELNYNDMYQKLNSAIHAFAKRQMTWFRRMERKGTKINWIEGNTNTDLVINNVVDLWQNADRD